MTATTNQPSRRDLLKWFAGIPFLPLGAMTTAAALSGCNDNDNDKGSGLSIVVIMVIGLVCCAIAYIFTFKNWLHMGPHNIGNWEKYVGDKKEEFHKK